MMPPYFSFHSKAYFKNSSRPILFLSIPFSFSICTTFASVAIDAWSLPGTQHALKPLILALRTRISCTVSFSVCPMCKTPVTLGGGITTVKGFLSSGVELKYLLAFQCAVHFSSIAPGSKFFDNSICSILFFYFPRFSNSNHLPLRRTLVLQSFFSAI